MISLAQEYSNSSLGDLRGVVNIEANKFYLSPEEENKIFLLEVDQTTKQI